jgi:predicted transcriptional regulator of viral defense system
MKRTSPRRFMKPRAIFKAHNGLLRTSHALKLGIHPETLYAMKKHGFIELVSRGLYRLSGPTALSHPDLAAIALKVPQGVICLISALSFHNITTQIPHEVHVALKFPSRRPKVDYPPTNYIWLSSPSFEEGIETHKVDGIALRVYSAEKTVADCFKFRNKVGLDVAIEALKFCRERKRSSVGTLVKYAKIDRVDKIMKPYLEAIL